MAIFDTHAHYVKNDFGEALHPLLSSMSEAGVEKIMAVGYDLDSSREEMQLAEQYPFVWAAVGVHPENCEGLPADWLGQLAGMLSSPRVKALGEIGSTAITRAATRFCRRRYSSGSCSSRRR